MSMLPTMTADEIGRSASLQLGLRSIGVPNQHLLRTQLTDQLVAFFCHLV